MRFAQVGTRHGHAAGKLRALLDSPDVDFAGVYEPDPDRRDALRSGDGPFAGVPFFDRIDDILEDESIAAVASEGANAESLPQTEALVEAGKHVWYDKPAGTDYDRWRRVVEHARGNGTLLQLGYMFRYHDGFARIAAWAGKGVLGEVRTVRAHMSTNIPAERREDMSVFRGGIFFDLGAHMLDQIVWLLGRPSGVASFLRNDSGEGAGCPDNTLAVFEFERALAFVDISACEPRPVPRRFEVYGSEGHAILLEPFEPGDRIRLTLSSARDGFVEGEQEVAFDGVSRQTLYERELAAFLGVVERGREPDRSPDHELLVQETLLRATGDLTP